MGAKGDNSFGLRTMAPITGNIDVFANVQVQGQNATAISIEAPVDGRVTIQSEITASGYRFLRRSEVPRDIEDVDADDKLIGGPAVRMAASATRGFLLDGPPPVIDPTDANGDGVVDDTDQDDDGVIDSSERTGIVNSFGSAPAVVIGAPGAITLGNAGTGQNNYGVAINGVVLAGGTYDGIASTGLQIGGLGGTVNTSNGIGINGQIVTTAFQADSTAIHIGAGTTAPSLDINSGNISAGVNTIEGILVDSRGIQIDAGAHVGVINNSGTIRAGVNGPAGNATAILDSSGEVVTVNNSNIILASLRTTDGLAEAEGETIAIDLRANTTGAVVTQTSRGQGATPPSIGGDILFSDGVHNDSLIVLSGVTEGLMAFGGGNDVLAADGDSVVRGGLSKNGGTLDVALGDAKLDLTQTGVATVTNLVAGSSSTLAFTADPAQTNPAQRISSLNVTNQANLNNGAQLQLHFTSKLLQDETFTVLSANTLINEGLIVDLTGQVPALFSGAVEFGANSINIVTRRRTATELGLSGARARAFEGFYQAFDADDEVGLQFLGKITNEEFNDLYEQFLPDYSGGPFRTLSGTIREGMQAQAELPIGNQSNEPRSWLQEIGLTVKQETVNEVPYQTGGFGVIAGYERPDGNDGFIGFSGSYMSSEIRNQMRFLGSHLAASAVTGGVYARRPYGGLMLDADLTGGLAWFDSTRRIVDQNAANQQVLIRQAEGHWTGLIGAARIGALYDMKVGSWYLRPAGSIDGIYLREGSYTERGGGPSVNLAVDTRTSYEATAQLGVKFGTSFGRGYRWGPEFELGYRSVLAGEAGETTAAFASTSGSEFILAGVQRAKRLLVIRAALRGQGAYSNFTFETGGEIGENYEAYMARLAIRFVF